MFGGILQTLQTLEIYSNYRTRVLITGTFLRVNKRFMTQQFSETYLTPVSGG